MNSKTRTRIIDVAEAAFFRDGVRAVTMDELAARLAMSKRTVYENFDSKEELLREVLFRRTRRIDEILEDVTGQPFSSFAEKFHTVLQKVAEAVPQPSRRFMRDMRVAVPEIWDELTIERRRILSSHLGPLFEEGQREGVLREDLDSDITLRMFLAMVQGLINPDVLCQLPLSAPQALDLIVSVLSTGVFTPAARRQSWDLRHCSEAEA